MMYPLWYVSTQKKVAHVVLGGVGGAAAGRQRGSRNGNDRALVATYLLVAALTVPVPAGVAAALPAGGGVALAVLGSHWGRATDAFACAACSRPKVKVGGACRNPSDSYFFCSCCSF